jgi:hypothetical protein
MALAVSANPTEPAAPPEAKGDALLDDLPGAGKAGCNLCGGTLDELVAAAPTWEPAADRDVTHLGLAVWQVRSDTGQQYWLAVSVAAQLLPKLEPELLNAGQRDFALACHLCGHQFVGRIETPRGGNTGTMATPCRKCKLRFDVFGVDVQGKYHRPPWFLRGYRPMAVEDPLAIWMRVLSGYRYVPDEKRFRRLDVWQLARETHLWRQGDCEDTAILLADWLAASGHRARVVTGRVHRGPHAWVVLRQDGHEYVLETTGGRGHFRRMPPRAALLPRYFPLVQFDRTGVWFRKRNAWTPRYFTNAEWARGPWPLARPAPARRR